MQNQVNSLIISYPSRMSLGNTFSLLHNLLSQVGFSRSRLQWRMVCGRFIGECCLGQDLRGNKESRNERSQTVMRHEEDCNGFVDLSWVAAQELGLYSSLHRPVLDAGRECDLTQLRTSVANTPISGVLVSQLSGKRKTKQNRKPKKHKTLMYSVCPLL